MKRLVLVGGGHAHIEVLRDLATRPSRNIATTLVTPFPRMIYTAMLPGYVAGHYALDECTVDGERVTPQPGDFYGGWLTSGITGPFKGGPGTRGW